MLSWPSSSARRKKKRPRYGGNDKYISLLR
nr:MAG TPA_asm: hypothetical protein [Caudoviricetes sp.]